MNEGAKTGIYWAVAAAVAGLAAVVAWPGSSEQLSAAGEIGKPLFASFEDPTAAASLRIVEFDEEQGELSSFEVAKSRESGAWTIPSHGGYPADATEQMRNAATAFLGVKILDVASEIPEDHARFGVLEPDVERRRAGDAGVGSLVVIEDGEGDRVVELIVGSEVRNAEGQRYVRKPKEDVVYVANLDTAPLTTKFQNWIDRDLLQLDTFDIGQITLRDYSVVRTLQGAQLDRKFDAHLSVTDSGDWELDKLVVHDGGQSSERELGEDEELNAQKLNELKNALDELEIVDVRRKPAGLSEDLKADEGFMNDQQAMASLNSRGFYPQPTTDGRGEVYAANGELIVTQQDGVEYLLRFGEVEGVSGDEEGEDAEDVGGLNRYLLVSARVNESVLPEPELRPLPESLEDVRDEDAEPADEDAAADEDQPAVAAEPSEDADAPQPAEGSGDDDVSEITTGEATGETSGSGDGAAQEDAATDEEPADEEPADEEPVDEEPVDEEPVDEEPVDEEPVDEEPVDEEPADEDPMDEEPMDEDGGAAVDEVEVGETAEERQERLEAERERVARENQRKIDERNERLEEAQTRVAELNARFADWYYVVPERTYRKLRLSREDLIQPEGEGTQPQPGPEQPFPGQGPIPQGLFPE